MKFEWLSSEDISKLQSKVLREYAQADRHTSSWKESVRNVWRDYLLEQPREDKVKVRKVLNNLTIRLSTFLHDEIQVKSISSNGQLGQEVAENANRMYEYNFESMGIKNKYREVLMDDGLTGVGCLAVDGWNDHEQEPMVSYIDSRLTYPDPKNWQDSNMRFFGTKLRKSLYELEADDAYDNSAIQKVKLFEDFDISQVDRDNDDLKWFQETEKWEDQVDIYNHITVFKGKKDTTACLYLTSWGSDITELMRLVKMRPLTKGEMADPSTIDFGIKLFRAKPLKGSYAGISIIDDVGQYQDLETLLTNLSIRQAIEAAVGGRTLIDSRLWINLDDMANNKAIWSTIPFTPNATANITAQNGIYQEPTKPQNPVIPNTINQLWQLAQLADPSGNALSQWMSQGWAQTKAEVQTLQENINQVLSYMASNYMDSLKWLWTSITRKYQTDMSSQRTKEIALSNYKGQWRAYGFKKNQFVPDGKIFIQIVSKAQQAIKDSQDFAKILSVVSILKQSVKPGSVQDTIINRVLLQKSGIRGIKPEDLYPLTRDERIAYSNVEFLNQDLEIKTKPKGWEDHNVYINIYKQGIETNAQEKAIFEREQMILNEGLGTANGEIEWESVWGGWEARQLGASMIAQENAQWGTPSLWSVTA